MRAKFILFSIHIAVLLCACGTKPSEIGNLWSIVKGISSAGEEASIVTVDEIRERLSPEIVAQFRGAPLLIAELDQPRVASVLFGVGKNEDIVTYYTPDQISLSFRGGVLVATRGLGFDLMIADVDLGRGGFPPQGEIVRRVHETLNGDNTIRTQHFFCEIEYPSRTRLVERCDDGGVSFENTYNFGLDGSIKSSRQWISEERGYIYTESI